MTSENWQLESIMQCIKASSMILGGKGVLHAKELQYMEYDSEEDWQDIDNFVLEGINEKSMGALISGSPYTSVVRHVRFKECDGGEDVLALLYKFSGTRYETLLPVTLLFTSIEGSVLVYLPSDHPKARKSIVFEPTRGDKNVITRFQSVRAVSSVITKRLCGAEPVYVSIMIRSSGTKKSPREEEPKKGTTKKSAENGKHPKSATATTKESFGNATSPGRTAPSSQPTFERGKFESFGGRSPNRSPASLNIVSPRPFSEKEGFEAFVNATSEAKNSLSPSSKSPSTKTPRFPVASKPQSPVFKAPPSPMTKTSPVAKSPRSPAKKASPVAKSPRSPVSKVPKSPVAKSPRDPVAKTPRSPVAKAPPSPVTKTPRSPTRNQPLTQSSPKTSPNKSKKQSKWATAQDVGDDFIPQDDTTPPASPSADAPPSEGPGGSPNQNVDDFNERLLNQNNTKRFTHHWSTETELGNKPSPRKGPEINIDTHARHDFVRTESGRTSPREQVDYMLNPTSGKRPSPRKLSDLQHHGWDISQANAPSPSTVSTCSSPGAGFGNTMMSRGFGSPRLDVPGDEASDTTWERLLKYRTSNPRAGEAKYSSVDHDYREAKLEEDLTGFYRVDDHDDGDSNSESGSPRRRVTLNSYRTSNSEYGCPQAIDMHYYDSITSPKPNANTGTFAQRKSVDTSNSPRYQSYGEELSPSAYRRRKPIDMSFYDTVASPSPQSRQAPHLVSSIYSYSPPSPKEDKKPVAHHFDVEEPVKVTVPPLSFKQKPPILTEDPIESPPKPDSARLNPKQKTQLNKDKLHFISEMNKLKQQVLNEKEQSKKKIKQMRMAHGREVISKIDEALPEDLWSEEMDIEVDRACQGLESLASQQNPDSARMFSESKRESEMENDDEVELDHMTFEDIRDSIDRNPTKPSTISSQTFHDEPFPPEDDERDSLSEESLPEEPAFQKIDKKTRNHNPSSAAPPKAHKPQRPASEYFTIPSPGHEEDPGMFSTHGHDIDNESLDGKQPSSPSGSRGVVLEFQMGDTEEEKKRRMKKFLSLKARKSTQTAGGLTSTNSARGLRPRLVDPQMPKSARFASESDATTSTVTPVPKPLDESAGWEPSRSRRAESKTEGAPTHLDSLEPEPQTWTNTLPHVDPDPVPSTTVRKSEPRSNVQLITNALTHVCLAGLHHSRRRETVLENMKNVTNSQFIIVFRNEVSLKFRGVYALQPNGVLGKVYGPRSLPDTIDATMVDAFYKYNTGQKSFVKLGSKSFSTTTDAVSLQAKYFAKSAPENL